MKQEQRIFGYNSDDKIKTDVFISYKRDKIDFVKRLVQELDTHDITVWVDYNELPKHIGKEYKNRIHKGIDNAQIVLFIYSKETELSQFIVDEEIGYASKHKKLICCYAYDTVDFPNMNKKLAGFVEQIQWLGRKDDIATIISAQEAIKDEKKRRILANSINDINVISSDFQDINLFLIRIAIQKLLGHPTPYGKFDILAKSDNIYTKDDSGIEMVVENKGFYIPIPDSKLEILQKKKFIKSKTSKKDEISKLLKTLDNWEGNKMDKTSLSSQLEDFIARHYEYKEIWEWLYAFNKELNLPHVNNFSYNEFINIVAELTTNDFIREIDEHHKTMFNGAMLGVLDIIDGRTANVEEHELIIKLYHSDYFTFKCTVTLYHILRSIRNEFEIKKENISSFAPFLCSLGMGGFIVIEQEEREMIMWAKRSDSISSGDMWHFSYDETVNLLKDAVRNIENGKETDIRINRDGSINIDPYKNLYRAIKEENGLSTEHIKGNCGILSVGIITSERLEIELLSFAKIKLNNSASVAMQMRRYQHAASDGYLEISKLEFKDIYDSVNNYIGRLLTPESHFLSEFLQMNRNTLLCNQNIGRNVILDKNVKIGQNVTIGDGSIIEEYSTLSDNVRIGRCCKIHRNVFVDEGVAIGDYVKIQNNNSIYNGVILENGVFVGTNVSFTNDRKPRSIKEDGSPVKYGDWDKETTIIRRGASIGAGAVIRCGIEIGEWAMIGCGAVVTKNVPAGAVVIGPAAHIYNKSI